MLAVTCFSPRQVRWATQAGRCCRRLGELVGQGQGRPRRGPRVPRSCSLGGRGGVAGRYGVWAVVVTTFLQFGFLHRNRAGDHFATGPGNTGVSHRSAQARKAARERWLCGVWLPAHQRELSAGPLWALLLQRAPEASRVQGSSPSRESTLEREWERCASPRWCACAEFTRPMRSQAWPFGGGAQP